VIGRATQQFYDSLVSTVGSRRNASMTSAAAALMIDARDFDALSYSQTASLWVPRVSAVVSEKLRIDGPINSEDRLEIDDRGSPTPFRLTLQLLGAKRELGERNVKLSLDYSRRELDITLQKQLSDRHDVLNPGTHELSVNFDSSGL